MKPKGINVFEQHVEKVVLGVACVAAAGLGAVQFLTQPNAVQVGSETLPPSKVDEAVANKAAVLKTKLDSDRGLDVQQPGKLSEWFDAEHAPAIPSGRSVSSVPLVRAEKFKVGDGAEAATVDLYAEFAPPAPKAARAVSAHYTLDPDKAPKIEGMSKYLADAAPYDVNAVHIFATVDGKKVKENLTGTQVNRSIPGSWWEKDLNILDVTLERQRLGNDGAWGSTEVVPTIPGQVSFRDQIAATKPGYERALFDSALQAGAQVYEPDFLPLADDAVWTSDIGKPTVDLTNPALVAANRVVQSKWRALNDATDRLDKLKNPDRNKPKDRTNPSTSPETGKGSPTGTGETSPTTNSSSTKPTKSREEKMMDAAEKNLTAAKDAYAKAVKDAIAIDPKYIAPDVQKKIDDDKKKQEATRKPKKQDEPGAEPGSDPEAPVLDPEGTPEGVGKGQPLMDTGETASPRGGARQRGPQVAWLENDALEVWGHDLSAQPGATYRYRVVVQYTNPFFGREDRLADAQKALASSVTTPSTASEWTEPVYVVPSRQFFATDGRAGAGLDDRSATFEVYSFTAGEERMTSFSVKVGEPITALRNEKKDENTTVKIDFDTKATLLDVIDLGEAGEGMGRRVQVVVALEDGSVVVLDPEAQRSDDLRQKLKDEAAKASKS